MKCEGCGQAHPIGAPCPTFTFNTFVSARCGACRGELEALVAVEATRDAIFLQCLPDPCPRCIDEARMAGVAKVLEPLRRALVLFRKRCAYPSIDGHVDLIRRITEELAKERIAL
jgi:hypothetical protein